MSAGRVAVGIACPRKDGAVPSRKAGSRAARFRTEARKILCANELLVACKISFPACLDADRLPRARLEVICRPGGEDNGCETGLEGPALVLNVRRTKRDMAANDVLDATASGEQEISLVG